VEPRLGPAAAARSELSQARRVARWANLRGAIVIIVRDGMTKYTKLLSAWRSVATMATVHPTEYLIGLRRMSVASYLGRSVVFP
jgi:hypothetical protein